jgi:hypothetical protein
MCEVRRSLLSVNGNSCSALKVTVVPITALRQYFYPRRYAVRPEIRAHRETEEAREGARRGQRVGPGPTQAVRGLVNLDRRQFIVQALAWSTQVHRRRYGRSRPLTGSQRCRWLASRRKMAKPSESQRESCFSWKDASFSQKRVSNLRAKVAGRGQMIHSDSNPVKMGRDLVLPQPET